MTPDYKPIEKYLKELRYLQMDSYVRTWFGGRVIGFNVSAPSNIRKNYTMQRVNEEIEKHDMPLIVDDYLGDGYSSFRLMIKL